MVSTRFGLAKFGVAAIPAFVFLLATPVLAQSTGDPGASQPAGDPGIAQPAGDPGAMQPAADPEVTQPAGDPGVARLSVLSGGVDIQRGDSGDTFAAALNAPVSGGDYITTSDDSQAEVEFNYGAALRVAPDTQLRFTQLAAQDHELQIAQGTVELRVFRGLESHPEVDTPGATIHPDASGSYRITVTEDGNTQVTVRDGQADVTIASQTQTIGPGSTLVVSGTGAGAQVQTIASVPMDSFDSFNQTRDSYVAGTHDSRFVDAGMVGAEDLDAYGTWSDNPTYGQVWVPAQAPGWAPYHDGNWVWEPYYGWTWVGDEPWGWAPYHYGNWFYAAGTGWAWYPGTYAVARPYVYRPALVAFFSFGGGGGGLSVGFGNVGWVPIAPYEPFHAWWGNGGWGGGWHGPTVVSNTTIINNTYVNNGNVTRIYSNASAPGGAVAVSNGNFASGHFTHVQPVTAEQLQGVEPVTGVVPIVPTSRNLAFNPRAPQPLTTSTIAAGKFTNFAPPPRAATSFTEQRSAVASVAQKAYPEHATVFERQAQTLHPLGASALGDEPVSPEHESVTQGKPAYSESPSKPAYSQSQGTSNPWSRFGSQGAQTENKPEGNGYRAPQTGDPPSSYGTSKAYGAGKTYGAKRTTKSRPSHPAHPSEPKPQS